MEYLVKKEAAIEDLDTEEGQKKKKKA